MDIANNTPFYFPSGELIDNLISGMACYLLSSKLAPVSTSAIPDRKQIPAPRINYPVPDGAISCILDWTQN